MTGEPDLQHVSYAVPDALAAARALIVESGAVPVAGEALPDFRYVLMHLGGAVGGYVELMEPFPRSPRGTGFLHRFLARHGGGAHHLTWMVPDLERCVSDARALGFTVVGEDYRAASWEEAFLMPHTATGCVIQLARSNRDYPPATSWEQGTPALHDLPESASALDRDWWVSLRDVPRGPHAEWGGIDMHSTQPELLAALLVDVLGGEAGTQGDITTYAWPGGVLTLASADSSGIAGFRTVVRKRGTRQSAGTCTPG